MKSFSCIVLCRSVPVVLFLTFGCFSQSDEGLGSTEMLTTPHKVGDASQVAIIKVDDFVPGPDSLIHPKWQDFIDYVRAKGIKSSFGIIGIAFPGGNQAYFDSVRGLSEGGVFEFWNHGYNHLVNQIDSLGNHWSEFSGTSEEYQRAHLDSTQQVVDRLAQIVLRGFGAPGNKWDKTTATILEEKPFGLDYWFHGYPAEQNIFVFDDNGKTERPVGHPDFDYFVANYSPSYPYVLLEIHPRRWRASDYSTFDMIVDFLLLQGATFVLPSEYLDLP